MEKALKCEFCSEEFNSRHKLNAHIKREHSSALHNKPRKHLKCNLCGYEANREAKLIIHMRIHTGERPFQCTVNGCGTAFKEVTTLKNHIKFKHSEDRPFKCNFPGCTYTAKVSTHLISHKNVHNDEKLFACSECDYKTNKNNNLKLHRRRLHSARRDFKCSYPQCSKSFKVSVDLKSHFDNVHKEKNVPCDHPGCDQKFSNANALNTHRRNVHSIKSLVCPKLNCSYRTNNAGNLARHGVVHHGGNEKISCSIKGCHYKGENSRALERHVYRNRTHLPCPVSGCGHFALSNKILEDHVKTHDHLDRPYQCPLCFKHFRKMSHLQNHCDVHTNEKPYACGHCKLTGSIRSNIKKHISSKHANIRFPFIVHLLDDRECLDCKVILPIAEFLLHCKDHGVTDV